MQCMHPSPRFFDGIQPPSWCRNCLEFLLPAPSGRTAHSSRMIPVFVRQRTRGRTDEHLIERRPFSRRSAVAQAPAAERSASCCELLATACLLTAAPQSSSASEETPDIACPRCLRRPFRAGAHRMTSARSDGTRLGCAVSPFVLYICSGSTQSFDIHRSALISHP